MKDNIVISYLLSNMKIPALSWGFAVAFWILMFLTKIPKNENFGYMPKKSTSTWSCMLLAHAKACKTNVTTNNQLGMCQKVIKISQSNRQIEQTCHFQCLLIGILPFHLHCVYESLYFWKETVDVQVTDVMLHYQNIKITQKFSNPD